MLYIAIITSMVGFILTIPKLLLTISFSLHQYISSTKKRNNTLEASFGIPGASTYHNSYHISLIFLINIYTHKLLFVYDLLVRANNKT